jgi:hypothetical protein
MSRSRSRLLRTVKQISISNTTSTCWTCSRLTVHSVSGVQAFERQGGPHAWDKHGQGYLGAVLSDDIDVAKDFVARNNQKRASAGRFKTWRADQQSYRPRTADSSDDCRRPVAEWLSWTPSDRPLTRRAMVIVIPGWHCC